MRNTPLSSIKDMFLSVSSSLDKLDHKTFLKNAETYIMEQLSLENTYPIGQNQIVMMEKEIKHLMDICYKQGRTIEDLTDQINGKIT
jgi:hypothetical protein